MSCNGNLSKDLAEVAEWSKSLDTVKEINIYGNLTGIADDVFATKNKVNVYLKTSMAAKISEKAFGDEKNAVIYLNSATELDGVKEPDGFEYHSMGTSDLQEAFSYTIDGDTFIIYSHNRTMPLSTTSGDTALVNFAKDNAATIKSVEIRGEFASIGNMQPVFSKLTSATSVKIDHRNSALSGEKNFMGMSALMSLGHYNFIENTATTYSDGKVDLTGFTSWIDGGGNNGIPAYILSGCKSVKTIITPDTLMCNGTNVAGAVGEKAFADCSSLEIVEFPIHAELTSFAFGVFSKCTSLQKVLVKGAVAKNFSCVLNISKLQSFAQVPDTAVFEVGTDEFADIINAKLAEGELAIKAISNGTYTPPVDDNKGSGAVGDKNNNPIDFGNNMDMVIIIASVAAVIVVAIILIAVIPKKKKKK